MDLRHLQRLAVKRLSLLTVVDIELNCCEVQNCTGYSQSKLLNIRAALQSLSYET